MLSITKEMCRRQKLLKIKTEDGSD